jgi:dTMP kinase
LFVAVEGIEGSGKSTLVDGLAGALRADGYEVIVTREPGGTAIGNAVRAIFLDPTLRMEPLTESLLVNAARAEHVKDVIRPALDAQRIVLCDRFVDSTLAYQGFGRGLPLEKLRAICDAATGGLEPDLVLLLDVPVSVARKRLGERSHAADRIEREDDDFHERVRRGFLELAKSPQHEILDGTISADLLLNCALAEIRGALKAHAQ